MKPPLVLLLGIVATMLSSRALGSGEGPVVIHNKFLDVRADRKTGEITILAKGKPILTKARIGTGELRDKVSVIGRGNAHRGLININAPDFGNAIALTDDSPFAFIWIGIGNRTKTPMIVNRAPVFRGIAALTSSPDQIKVLGTGGLSSPDKRIGSYMWLTVAEPRSNSGIVAGFVTADRGSGVVFVENKDGQLELDSQVELGRKTIAPRVPDGPDTDVVLESFVIGYFDDVRDGLEAWANEVAKQNNIKLPRQPSGYCTWYHARASDEKSMVKQTEIAAKDLRPYGFDFLQIDDGWQDGDKSNGPRKNFTRIRTDGPYPSGMKQTAEVISSHGFTPGIWFMPFAGTFNDPWFKDHQDWFVKRADGSPYDTAWGGTCMDMTNPDARKYLHDYVHKITHDWGYRYLKMDGLSTGAGVTPQYVNLAYKDDHMGDAVFHDPSKTNIEAFRSGLKLVREAAGPGVFLLGCCAPQNMRSYGGAFGLVDAMRVGPDNNGSNWRGILRGPSIASRHYHLNGRIWYNDPDAVYVRNSITLDQARANASWVNITGQLFVVSDDFSKLTSDRLDVLKRVMPAHGRHARPIDLLEEEVPRIWHVADTRGPVRRDVVALFNWDGKSTWAADYPLDHIGLPVAKSYVAYDFWGDRLLPPVADRLKATLSKSSCLILAVRPVSNHPQLISTSRHVTQGMIDVTDEKWDAATQTLSGTSKLVPGDLYELRIATGGKAWKAASLDADLETIKPTIINDDGLVRVHLTVPPKEPADWHWAIKMTKTE
jgi:hypothetical protein